MRHQAGFTLIEMMVTLAIISVLAMLVVPVAQVSVQRAKEQELRTALREIRHAIDAYKAASDEGRIARDALASGYPASLQVLLEGSEDRQQPKQKLRFLRRLPRDPFFPDPEVPAEQTWGLRSYASEASDPRAGNDVYDVHSTALLSGLNGIAYKDW
jgi:general secretion pathway protein G